MNHMSNSETYLMIWWFYIIKVRHILLQYRFDMPNIQNTIAFCSAQAHKIPDENMIQNDNKSNCPIIYPHSKGVHSI